MGKDPAKKTKPGKTSDTTPKPKPKRSPELEEGKKLQKDIKACLDFLQLSTSNLWFLKFAWSNTKHLPKNGPGKNDNVK